MPDTIIKISGVGALGATTNSVAAIDTPEDGEISAIYGTVRGQQMTVDDFAIAELSFLSTNQISVNDARGAILEVSVCTHTLVSGGMRTCEVIALSLNPGIPVQAGERIHMHLSGSAGTTPSATFMIYLLTGGGGRRARRRR